MRGAADIVKNPSEWVFIGEYEYRQIEAKIHAKLLAPGLIAQTDNGRFMKLVPSDIDFAGGGRGFAVCFDAKATNGDRFPLLNIKPHQVQRIKESAKCGTIAGFMIRFTEHRRVFFIRSVEISKKFENWEKSKIRGSRAAKGTASLSIAELEQNSIEIFRNKMNSTWDWLPYLVK